LSLTKIDLVLHPVRLRILQTLTGESLTTQEISDRLPDVPTSSIYRHLKMLLDGDMVVVVETRQVKGIEEKFYHAANTAHLGAEEMAGLSAVDHIRYFTTYVLTLLRGFGEYVETAETTVSGIDMLADYVGYNDVAFWATTAELDAMVAAINQAVMPLLQNGPGNGRRKHKLATITHPIFTE
jgi:DNA-binding transcriptional ArsR family regulator